MVDKEKFGKIQQEYSKNQTCLEKLNIYSIYILYNKNQGYQEKLNKNITKNKVA